MIIMHNTSRYLALGLMLVLLSGTIPDGLLAAPADNRGPR